MKSKLLIILAILLLNQAYGQSSGGLQQYYYAGNNTGTSIVPVAHFQSSKNWYTEARYNYEELKTFSLYAGKTFSRNAGVSYTATPIIGGVFGQMNGGSVGINFDMDYKDLFFSSQSQYTFSVEDRNENYIYSWSELAYQANRWMYAGIAMQQTNVYRTDGQYNTGVLVGFMYKDLTIPVYVFSPGSLQRYFVLGVNWQWQYGDKHTKSYTPSSLAKY